MNFYILSGIIVVLLLEVPLFYWLWRYIKKRRLKQIQVLRDFCSELGMKMGAEDSLMGRQAQKKESIFSMPSFRGNFYGKKVILALTSKSAGQAQIPYVSLRFEVENPSGLKMHLIPEHPLSGVGKFFGMQDIVIGDGRIDDGYIIKSSDAIFMKVAFIPEIVAHFHKLMDSEAKGAISLSGEILQFEEAGGIQSDGMKKKIREALILLRDLSDVVSVYRR